MKLDLPLKGFWHVRKDAEHKGVHLLGVVITVVTGEALDTEMSRPIGLHRLERAVNMLAHVRSKLKVIGTRRVVTVLNVGVVILDSEPSLCRSQTDVVNDAESDTILVISALVMNIIR